MDEAGKSFWSDRADARKWIGRIVMAVILGEAIWHLIVSVMDYVVVPWLGDVMGQSSGLPTSFTQRPYDYPDLFVSVLEFCIAGIVAVSINWFFQRPGKPVRVQARTTSAVVPQATVPAPAAPQPAVTPQPVAPKPPIAPPPAPVAVPVAQVTAAAPAAPKPAVAAAPIPPTPPIAPRPTPAPPPVPAAAKPAPTPPPQPQPPKPQPAKKKEVYYNIVGEPVSDDDD